MFATYFASVKKRWNAECMVRHLEAAPLWGQNVCDIFCISEKSSFTQVLDCKWMALVSVSRLQSSTWVKELFSLMQNMSQTFCPQSGAASRHLTVHAAFHLFFTDAKYVANILFGTDPRRGE